MRDPDDIFGPDEQIPRGPVIDVTPGKKRGGVDFDSDKPPIEQIIEEGDAIKREDKRPETGCFGRVISLVCLLVLSGYLLFSFLLR